MVKREDGAEEGQEQQGGEEEEEEDEEEVRGFCRGMMAGSGCL